MLASTTLNTSQLIANEESESEIQVDFKLLGQPALPRGSEVVLTLALPPAHRTDVEKSRAELDIAKIAAQKMDDMKKGGALKRLRTVTEMISKLHDVLDEASKVRGDIFYFALYLLVFADSSGR